MTTRHMLPRERVFAALDFRPPDILPLEYHASPSGSFEHGERLHQLWERYPQDFGLTSVFPHAGPEPRWVDAQGRYCEVRRDEWGVVWEHLIFGAAGHPLERPLDDWSNLDRYQPPPDPVTSGPEFERERARAQCHQQRYFHKSGWINLFEVMIAVRRFEDVLMDIASDTTEINRLADLITDYQLKRVHYLLARGVDAIQFGDDFSTQFDLMMSLRDLAEVLQAALRAPDEAGPRRRQESLLPHVRMRPQAFGGFCRPCGCMPSGLRSTFTIPLNSPGDAARQKSPSPSTPTAES